MKVKLKKGDNAEDVFGFSKKKSMELIQSVSDIINNGKTFMEGILDIYNIAKNSKELGYMLIYYVSIYHAISFDKFMDEIAENGMRMEDDNTTHMYG